MNTIPEPVNPVDVDVPGTQFTDRVIGGSKGMATQQATVLLGKVTKSKKQIEINTEDISTLQSDLVALTLALG